MIYANTLSKSNPTDILKRAMHTASYYGFDNIEKTITQHKKQLEIESEDENISYKNKLSTNGAPLSTVKHKSKQQTDTCDAMSNEIIQALQTTIDNNLLPSKYPVLIYQNTTMNSKENGNQTFNFGLIAIGMRKSIAEALVIKTASAILEEIGLTEIQVHINSIGDKDASQKFFNEINLYFKKHINSFPSQIRQYIKNDIFRAYKELYKQYGPIDESIPQSIRFLSDTSRKHLSEILEYLETGGIQYEIDNFLIGNNKCHPQTLFEIRYPEHRNDNVSVLAKGGRYDELARKMFNVDIPTVGIIFEFEKKGIKEEDFQSIRMRKPKVYFIQLGYEAKMRSLSVIDTLRKANMPTYHSLYNDKLGEQFSLARYFKVPYVIIMGHREALDGTVIVRNTDTQFQHTVLIDDLSQYIKGCSFR